uniref:Putative secreted protein n=1 Tax=Ixodes ricinus TaxID=34613 RepID=A0A6B0UW73_IXORI
MGAAQIAATSLPLFSWSFSILPTVALAAKLSEPLRPPGSTTTSYGDCLTASSRLLSGTTTTSRLHFTGLVPVNPAIVTSIPALLSTSADMMASISSAPSARIRSAVLAMLCSEEESRRRKMMGRLRTLINTLNFEPINKFAEKNIYCCPLLPSLIS